MVTKVTVELKYSQLAPTYIAHELFRRLIIVQTILFVYVIAFRIKCKCLKNLRTRLVNSNSRYDFKIKFMNFTLTVLFMRLSCHNVIIDVKINDVTGINFCLFIFDHIVYSVEPSSGDYKTC